MRASRRRSTVGETSPRRCRAPSAQVVRRPRRTSASVLRVDRDRPGAAAMRVVRSKRAPDGSTCSTTPLASSGEERLASWALETIRGRVEDRHRATPEHPEHLVPVVRGHHRGGVLVDARCRAAAATAPRSSAAGRSGCAGRSAGRSPPTGPGRGRPPPGSSAAWGWRRRRRRPPCGRTGCWPRPRCRRSRRPRSWAAHDRVAERRAADDGRQLELVAAGHEDAGRVVERGDERRVVGVARGSPGAPGPPRRRPACGRAASYTSTTSAPRDEAVGDDRDPGAGCRRWPRRTP